MHTRHSVKGELPWDQWELPEANSSIRFFPLSVLYPVHGAGFSQLTFFICLFTICNLLTHLWACLIYKCVSLFTLLTCSQFWCWRLSDTLTKTGKFPLGRYREFSMWVSNSLMIGVFESIHSTTIPVLREPFNETKGWLPSWFWKPLASGRFSTLLSAYDGGLVSEWLQSCWSVLKCSS